jgi:hypothetical protein
MDNPDKSIEPVEPLRSKRQICLKLPLIVNARSWLPTIHSIANVACSHCKNVYIRVQGSVLDLDDVNEKGKSKSSWLEMVIDIHMDNHQVR